MKKLLLVAALACVGVGSMSPVRPVSASDKDGITGVRPEVDRQGGGGIAGGSVESGLDGSSGSGAARSIDEADLERAPTVRERLFIFVLRNWPFVVRW